MDSVKPKEKTPETAVISACEKGGFGDLAATLVLAEQFERDNIPFSVHMKDHSIRKKYASIAGKCPVFRLSPKPYVLVSPVEMSRAQPLAEGSVSTIYISEYEQVRGDNSYQSEYDKNCINLYTGLGFEKCDWNIQPGIYIRNGLEQLLIDLDSIKGDEKSIAEIRKKVFKNIVQELPWFSFDISRYSEQLYDGNISLVYSSIIRNSWEFLHLAKLAELHLKKPLTIFLANNNVGIREFAYKESVRHGFSYSSKDKSIKGSNILIVELEQVNEKNFCSLVAIADTLSLVTGDHSLSEMIQKAGHSCGVPFFYQTASWKIDLSRSLSDKLSFTDKESARLFRAYVNNSAGTYVFSEGKDFEQKVIPKEETIARLFYDRDLISQYVNAAANIKTHFVNARRNAGIRHAETLWSINEIVSAILKQIMSGQSVTESVMPYISAGGKKRYFKHCKINPPGNSSGNLQLKPYT